ncbi:MFS transporter [Oharaeibacter diazotrophicus]|uniref:CP family cyanate transporter-like MFS transporter n=2 Tax=Oharaeibacter diazotrophicus TaxID=1920512 RepID=A0A4R6RDJ6_9HYPH|nr:MFS transporter [Oharaeibacter diazotrophicus]TDP84331.1 CP family cyanate transporter-like MFS transporter [Oharaeibacter diazotrophicus]BBE73368.1 putative transporter YycB [Pleomorphomonas sp. SM30]GLS75160.1 MFS transporter [Oharaeibacter diazotrophicus]
MTPPPPLDDDAPPLGEPLVDAELETDPPPPPTPVPVPGGRLLVGAALVLVAFNLRTVFSSLSSVLPDIARDLGLDGLFVGLATTLPVLCLGLFAPFAPRLAMRFGAERVVLVVLFLIAAGAALRALPLPAALLGGSMLAGAAIACGNVLLPGLVKRDFPDRAALMTGLYTMALCGGAAAAAGLTVPIERATGSWSLALAAWALPAAAVLPLWLPLRPPAGAAGRHARPAVRGLLADPLAWQVTLFMGLQSALAYSVFGWLAPILRDRGVDPLTAGVVVSVSVAFQTASCLVAPAIAVRGRDQRVIDVVLVAFAVAGLVGCLFAPLPAMWVFAAVQGIGQGGLIAVAMTLIVLRSPDPHVAAQLSSMAQTVGYVLASGGPLLVGLVHGRTGGFAATVWIYLGIGAVAAAAGWGAGRARLVRVRAEV